MTIVVLILHSIVCILLGVIILMQSGRGGGLTENFAAAGDMFGAQTNSLMIRITTVLCAIFLVTCLSLAFLSSRKEASLMANKVATQSGNPFNTAEPMETIEIPIPAADDAGAQAPAETKTP